MEAYCKLSQRKVDEAYLFGSCAQGQATIETNAARRPRFLSFLRSSPNPSLIVKVSTRVLGYPKKHLGAAHGFLHDMSGLIIFGAALILVYLVYYLEMKIEKLEG